jgi:hypothetical protein
VFSLQENDSNAVKKGWWFDGGLVRKRSRPPGMKTRFHDGTSAFF